jgi:TAP C-terminal domain
MAFARQPQQPAGLTQLAVKGWAAPPSKFAADPASGVTAIATFLEKKSQRKIHSYKDVGRNHVLLIDIDEADAPRFTHLNGFTFSGAPLTVEPSKPPSHHQQNGSQPPLGPRLDNQRIPSNPPGGPRLLQNRIETPPAGPRSNQRSFGQPNDLINGFQTGRQPQQHSPGKSEIESVLNEIIHKRYNAQEKYLTFEALATEPLMQQSGLSAQSAAKVFSAIFTVCEKVFETPAKRRDMVASVSLSNNGLKTVQDVIALSATFPQLKNLDLSNNQINEVGDMRFWRNAFRGLEHLILSGNPIDHKPQAKQQLTRWYRNMRLMNNAPLQANAAGMALDAGNEIKRAPSPAQPLPTQSHPEFPEGSTFGLPQPGKADDILVKEQMGLRFSFETRLKMQWVEQCLSANNFDYDKAMRNLQELSEAGQVPADAFLSV